MPYSAVAPDSPKAIRIVKHFDPHLPLTMVDPLEMQQVFLNLLMNAVQAMPSGGTVTATTFGNAAAKEIHIEIADTGMGISDEIREKIFQPFFTTKNKGTGLGLAISKQFIEMHGGTIVCREESGGRGHVPDYPSLYPSVRSASSRFIHLTADRRLID